jgi:hypothetical protein
MKGLTNPAFNQQFFLSYKLRFLTFCLLLSYAFAHTQLTGVYTDSPLQALMNGVARLPFAQRLLVPYLARILHSILPDITLSDLFFILEFSFTSLFFVAIKRLLGEFFTPNLAKVLSWLFLLLLPLVTVVNYRYGFVAPGEKAIFYPYDTPTLFFMTSGYFCCLTKRWTWFVITIFFATLNRESSLLLLGLLPVLHGKKTLILLRPLLFSSLSFVTAKILVLYLTIDLPGQYFELLHSGAKLSYFTLNLTWLFKLGYFPLLILSMAGLPVLWFCFFDFIPPQFRALRYLSSLYFIGLLCFGMLMEARIFEEIVILLYLPVCLAIERWLKHKEPFNAVNLCWLDYIKRYSIIGIFLIILLLQNHIYNLV